MKAWIGILVLMVGCGDKETPAEDSDSSTTPEDTATDTTDTETTDTETTDTETTTSDTDTTTPVGGDDYVVWSSHLGPSVRWDFGTKTVAEVGQFASIALDGHQAYWAEGWVDPLYFIGDGFGNDYTPANGPYLIINDTMVTNTDGVWTASDLDGANSRPWAAPQYLEGGSYTNLNDGKIGFCRKIVEGFYENYYSEVWDVSVEPPVQIYSIQFPRYQCSSPIASNDGTIWYWDSYWEEIHIVDQSGTILNTFPEPGKTAFGPEEDDLYMSGFIGPTPDGKMRVFAEQGFATYATGILSSDGSVALDTIIADVGMFTNHAKTDPTGAVIFAMSTDIGEPGLGMIDHASGVLLDFIPAVQATGATATIEWAGIP